MADVLVLYQISNELPAGTRHAGGSAAPPPSYNAFPVPRRGGITLASVKRSCRALQLSHPEGADGFHWRVRIDERPNTSHSSGGAGYSWWDVQDENARLPVKEATPSELKRMLLPKKETEGDAVTQEVTKAAKGAMKFMGKAAAAVAGSHDAGMDDDDAHAVRTPVICFKLLDLGRVRREFGGAAAPVGGGARRAARPARRTAAGASSAPSSRAATPSKPQQRQPAPAPAGAPRIPPRARQPRAAPPAQSTPPTADLMGFHAAPAPAPASRTLHHANSMPARTSASTPTGAQPGETRAEKLKREYAQKQATSRRVWDDVDQRWVEGPVKNGEVKAAPSNSGSFAGSARSDSGVDGAAAAVKGISLSRDNAVGKSANVQAAVHARIDDMETSQAKAIGELRAREAAKATADAEEDLVRQRLEPKLKAWSEEHGKKKQLRALLANLHTILWEGSGWKPVSLADVLDDSKVKRVYHKASRVVHPDKTGHLDAEKRFIAKRAFDALTQAKVEFDEGKR